MVGRVVTLLVSIDGKVQVGFIYQMPLERKAPGVIFRQPVTNHYKQGLKQLML
jgi:F-type H+-transporting ATPase subunit alpha